MALSQILLSLHVFPLHIQLLMPGGSFPCQLLPHTWTTIVLLCFIGWPSSCSFLMRSCFGVPTTAARCHNSGGTKVGTNYNMSYMASPALLLRHGDGVGGAAPRENYFWKAPKLSRWWEQPRQGGKIGIRSNLCKPVFSKPLHRGGLSTGERLLTAAGSWSRKWL